MWAGGRVGGYYYYFLRYYILIHHYKTSKPNKQYKVMLSLKVNFSYSAFLFWFEMSNQLLRLLLLTTTLTVSQVKQQRTHLTTWLL